MLELLLDDEVELEEDSSAIPCTGTSVMKP